MKTLFHLVSGQNSQVYIMSKFYKPEKNILLYTEATKKNLPALREVLKDSEVQEVSTHAFKYSKIRNVIRMAVEENRGDGNELLFNITGGTKIQSIAMYEIARENSCISAYLNSESHNITELGGDEPKQIPITGLEIEPTDYLLANGQKTKQIEEKKSQYAGELADLFSHKFDLFVPIANEFALKFQKISSLPHRKEWTKGLIKGSTYEIRKGEFYLKLVLAGETVFEVTDRPSGPLMKDFAGLWIEKAAFSIIQSNPMFSNPQINTRIVYENSTDKNEFDILAMLGTDLCLFECKSGKIKASDIDQLVALKKMLGSYTRLFIITYFPPSPVMDERLKENNIMWLLFKDLRNSLQRISEKNANI